MDQTSQLETDSYVYRVNEAEGRTRHLNIGTEPIQKVSNSEDVSKIDRAIMGAKGFTPFGDTETYVPKYQPTTFNEFKRILKTFHPNLLLVFNETNYGCHAVYFTYPKSVTSFDASNQLISQTTIGKKYVTCVGQGKNKTILSHSVMESKDHGFGVKQFYKSKGWQQCLDDIIQFFIDNKIPFKIPSFNNQKLM